MICCSKTWLTGLWKYVTLICFKALKTLNFKFHSENARLTNCKWNEWQVLEISQQSNLKIFFLIFTEIFENFTSWLKRICLRVNHWKTNPIHISFGNFNEIFYISEYHQSSRTRWRNEETFLISFKLGRKGTTSVLFKEDASPKSNEKLYCRKKSTWVYDRQTSQSWKVGWTDSDHKC